MKLIYKIKEVKPKIFLLSFTDNYDLCMFFLRYQEFYESPSPNFRGKQFEILDFMQWYSKKYGNGAFTYPTDWGGFNIPSSVIKDIHNLSIIDRNIYDYEMLNIYRQCKKIHSDFYLIGALKSATTTINHEIAHGFFYTSPEYKKASSKLVQKLSKSARSHINKWLAKKGYTQKVFVDETQAYLSTGYNFKFPKQIMRHIDAASLKFQDLFKSTYNQ